MDFHKAFDSVMHEGQRFKLITYLLLLCYFQSCYDPVKLNTACFHCLMYADDVVCLSEPAAGLQEVHVLTY